MPNQIPTIIIDNFFETPSVIRNWALSLDYLVCKDHPAKGNWPGKRSSHLLHELDYHFHQRLCSKLIDYLPGYTSFERFESTFHLCTGNYDCGWVHRDSEQFGIGGMVYLNESYTNGCGTILYDVPENDDRVGYTEDFKSNVLTDDESVRAEGNKIIREKNKPFTSNTVCEARYNRCLLFDGQKYHSAGDFFGDNITNGRLTLVFFAKAI